MQIKIFYVLKFCIFKFKKYIINNLTYFIVKIKYIVSYIMYDNYQFNYQVHYKFDII